MEPLGPPHSIYIYEMARRDVVMMAQLSDQYKAGYYDKAEQPWNS